MAEQPDIIICYDGSDDSQLAVARAARLFPGRRALVLHVWEPLEDVASVPNIPGLHSVLDAGLKEMDEIGEGVSRRIAEDGAEVASDAGLVAEPLSLRGHGRAWRTIVSVARERDAAVIVMGRRGLSRVKKVLMGSVTSGVLDHADRPVLMVPASAARPRDRTPARPAEPDRVGAAVLTSPAPGGQSQDGNA